MFSIPRNKPFVVVNTDEKLSIDPILSSSYDTVRNITKSYNYLNQQEVLNEINPFFGIPNMGDNYEKQNNSRLMSTRLMNLIEDHIKEAIDCGFDDSMSKFKGHSHFAVRSTNCFIMFLSGIYLRSRIFTDSRWKTVV